MRLYTSGIKVPKLGSIQDRVIRDHLTNESKKETKKTQLLALLVTNMPSFNNQQQADEWAGSVKKIWDSYLGLEYGIEIPEHSEKEIQMKEYYVKKLRRLKPKLHLGQSGEYKVSGMEDLME